MTCAIVLASGSSIRRKLLAAAGVVFVVDPADVDEETGPFPAELAGKAMALAELKALHVSRRQPGALVVGCDQCGGIVGGAELQKPRDADHAAAQLLAMAGRAHAFFPAACLARDGVVVARVAQQATVRFRPFDEARARAYVATGEWRGSAGGYRIEERGAALVESVDGPLHAVLGLPLFPLLGALDAHA